MRCGRRGEPSAVTLSLPSLTVTFSPPTTQDPTSFRFVTVTASHSGSDASVRGPMFQGSHSQRLTGVQQEGPPTTPQPSPGVVWPGGDSPGERSDVNVEKAQKTTVDASSTVVSLCGLCSLLDLQILALCPGLKRNFSPLRPALPQDQRLGGLQRVSTSLSVQHAHGPVFK